MQPLAPAEGAAAAAAAQQPGSHAFATMAAEDVRADAVFFHKFYAAREARAPRPRPRADGDSDDDSEDEIGAPTLGICSSYGFAACGSSGLSLGSVFTGPSAALRSLSHPCIAQPGPMTAGKSKSHASDAGAAACGAWC